MSPAAANTAEEQPEFTEMNPMAIQNQFPAEHQDISKLSDAERQAQIEEVLLNIANMQKQIQQGQKTDSAVAALPEGSASEMAFAPPVPKSERAARAPTPYSDVVDDEELVEDLPPTAIRNVKTEPAQASQANPTDLVINNVYSGLLHIDAGFHSFAEFDAAFRTWKEAGHHPMRIASSEALKDPSGRVDEKFRYKHAVFHCAHYGKPRFRGNGARPNQSYLPCGCPAMFRLNFNYGEQVLRVSSMNTEHVGHPVTYEHYKAVCSNIRSAKRSRTSGEAWTPNSSCTASPSTPYISTPYPVKQEIFQNEQSNDLVGSSTAPSHSSFLRREDDEDYTPNVKRTIMEAQPVTSSTAHHIQTTPGFENGGYQVNHDGSEDNVIDVPALPGLRKVQVGASYKNWSDFDASFENWKVVGMHPMRIASSETMKDLNGVPNLTFKYKYVVYHCAHYGIPRTRRNGMRPNQSYLPSGCGCMLRLAYNFEDQSLRVNAMVAQHRGHPRDRKSYESVMAKIRSSRGRHSTASLVNSAVSTPVSPFGATTPGTPNGAPLDYAKLASMLQAQTQMTIRLLQQSQSLPNSMNLDLAAILNGMGQNIQQQPTTSQNTEEINDIGRPVAQYLEGGEIVRELNADLKEL